MLGLQLKMQKFQQKLLELDANLINVQEIMIIYIHMKIMLQ